MIESVNVIGAGLAGSEAALSLAKYGYTINLFDMKPAKLSPAHTLKYSFCELICNNAFCKTANTNPYFLLYRELHTLDSEVLKLIEKTQIADSRCVAVDRLAFSNNVTNAIRNNPNINIIEKEVTSIPTDRPTVLATGPLTSERFRKSLELYFENFVQIRDASSIVLDFNSIDSSVLERLSDDVYYLHLNQSEYNMLEELLTSAETVVPYADNTDFRALQCLPIEVLATKKGVLAESKLSPQNKSAIATLIFRRDDRLRNSVVISEFTTRMREKEQRRIIRSIRGLKNAQFVRYGRNHDNTFINAHHFLNNSYEVKYDKGLYVIGQLSGIDGYLSAISSAIVAVRNIVATDNNLKVTNIPTDTMTGVLAQCVSKSSKQPPCTTLVPELRLFDRKISDDVQVKISLNSITEYNRLFIQAMQTD